MTSRASIMGHPLHPIFVTIPIGLWSFVIVSDLIYFAGGGDSWSRTALYCLGGGLLGAIPALITGWIDYGGIKDEEAGKIATFHFRLNMALLPFFAASFGLRLVDPTYYILAAVLSGVGVLILGASGWLGGELVSKYGVSVRARKTTA